jgi:Putative metal-binding motif
MARLPVRFGSCQVSVAAVCFLVVAAAGRNVSARPDGAPSTLFADDLIDGCNKCHKDNVNVPNVELTSSSVAITSGQQITLTFTVTTVNGNPGRAGFNIRSSQRGMFAVGGTAAGSAGTQVVTGYNGFPEATHTAPKAGEPATFTTLWTPGDGVSGAVTFTAWGNAVNFNGNNGGDRANATALDITVTCPQKTFYRDADGDGYGNAGNAMMACSAPAGFVADHTDCNDGSAGVHPGAAEMCNGVDDNCSGAIDEGGVCPVDAAADASDAASPADSPGADLIAEAGLDGNDAAGDAAVDVGPKDSAAADVPASGDAPPASEVAAEVAPATDTGSGDRDSSADAARETATIADSGILLPTSGGGGCSCRHSPSLSPSAAGLSTLLLALVLLLRGRRRRS